MRSVDAPLDLRGKTLNLRRRQRFLRTSQVVSGWVPTPTSDILEAEILGVTNLDPDGGSPSIGIDGNGWLLRVRTNALAGGSVPDASKFTVEVEDEQWTYSGGSWTQGTYTRTLTPSAAVRRPAPNNAVTLAIQGGSIVAPGSLTPGDPVDFYMVLPEFVYSGSASVTVSVEAGWYSTAAAGSGPGVTNSSTLDYPDPIYGFMNMPQEPVEAASCDVELWCNGHRHAMNGQAVAGVDLWATDGTNDGPVSTVTTTTLSTLQTREAIAEVFAASVDLTGVSDTDGSTSIGTGIQYIDGIIYPWIGPPYQISASGATWPTAQPCTPLRFVKDTAGKYGGAIAYFRTDGVAGSAPAVSRTLAGSYATARNTLAYATPALALAALAAYNNNAAASGRPGSAIAHNDLGGAKLYAVNGTTGVAATWELAGNISQAGGIAWFDMGPAPEADAAADYNQAGGLKIVPSLTRLRGGKLTKANTAGTFSANNTTPGNATMISVLDCEVALNSGTIAPYLRNVGLVYQRNINFSAAAAGAALPSLSVEGTSGLRCAQAIGITYGSAGTPGTTVQIAAYMAVGLSGNIDPVDINATQQTTNDGFIIDNAKFYQMGSATNFINNFAYTRGYYIGQSVFEFVAGQDLGIVLGGSSSVPVDNGLVEFLTLPQDKTSGVAADVGRLNHGYVDSAGRRGRVIHIGVSYCASAYFAAKSDVFAYYNGGGVTGATGNWTLAWNVHSKGNSIGINRPADLSGTEFGRKVYDAKTQHNIGDVGYTDNQAGISSSGFGTYTLTDSKLHDRVAAGEQRRKYDLAGALRRNDGTGAGGAYEW